MQTLGKTLLHACSSPHSETVMAVKEIGHVIHSPSFKVKQDAFVSKYMDQFEFGIEENKLQHTTIHDEYQRLVESWIEEGLGHKYDMRVVEAGIPQLAKSPGDDETAQTLMILTAMTDFLSFKEMMLQSKALLLKQAELSVGAAKALEEQCALIGSADLAWKPILTDPSLQIEKAKDDMGKEILRFSMVVEGTMEEVVDMLMYMGPERPQFDENCMSSEVLHELNGPTDVVVKMDLKMPTFIKYAMSVPNPMYMRATTKHDYPRPGLTSWFYQSWSWPANVPQEKGKGFYFEKFGVIQPGSSPGTCEMIGLNELPNWFPGWMFSQAYKGMVVKRMKNMLIAYRQYRAKA